jgi:hypothetical protein
MQQGLHYPIRLQFTTAISEEPFHPKLGVFIWTLAEAVALAVLWFAYTILL